MLKNNKIFIYRFNDSLRSPCYLLNYQDVNILLDCPIDISVLQNFLPRHSLLQKGASNLRESLTKPLDNNDKLCSIYNQIYLDTDLKFGFLNDGKIKGMHPDTIDAIIISNPLTMLGLPFIIQHFNFKGKMFATEPTIHFGSILMKEMIGNIHSLPKTNNSFTKNSVNFLRLNSIASFSAYDLSSWYDLYTEEAVTSAILRVQRVHFNEPINLFGLLTVRPVGSGFSIGSCNWLIESKHKRIAYFSHSSLINSHVKSIDLESFPEIDVALIGTAIQTAESYLDLTCAAMCEKICETIKSGGNVLVPINVCGLLFDIVERLYIELVRQGLEGRTQMFILSDQANASLAYANIYGEWLNGQRENQLYNADCPFNFDHLIRSNILIPCENINGVFSEKYRSPSIVFASHPSLRMGPAVHLLRLWSSDVRNGLFLVDTDNLAIVKKNDTYSYNIKRMLAPFYPLNMSVHCFLLENRIKVPELPTFIDNLSLSSKAAIVVPSEFLNVFKTKHSIKTIPISSDKFIELVFPDDENLITEEIVVTQSMCDLLKPINIDSEVSLSLFTSRINQRDGQSELITMPSTKEASRTMFGDLDPENLISQLHMRGLTEAKLEVIEEGKRYLVYFPEEDSLIQLNSNSTHVVCENEKMRKIIQEALMACFNVLSY